MTARFSRVTSPWRWARKGVVAVVGATVLAIGAALIVLPGPAVVVIPIGLAILATEFIWARRLLARVREGASRWLPRERRGAWAAVRLGRPVALAMLAVVASFSAALAFSYFRLEPVEEHALEVAHEATRAFDLLASFRSELLHFGMSANAYVLTGVSGGTVSREHVTDARWRVDGELAAFSAQLAGSGEEKAFAELVASLTLLDASMLKMLDLADAGELTAAQQVLLGEFNPLLERADGALASLRELSIERLRAKASAILEVRHTAVRRAGALGMTSLVLAVVATVLVIHMLQARTRLMQERNQLLSARAAELEAFAGRVAHDLRAPLGALALGVMSAKRRPETAPALRNPLDVMARQIQGLDCIIEGLLEFARAGANPPAGSRASLGQVLNDVIADMRPTAEAVSAELRVDPFPPTELACTPAALTSVLSNLLGNAVKYIADGKQAPRQIHVRVTDVEARARIEVNDNGPGLPPGSEALAFEPFRRVRQTKRPGVGLGLATVKKVVDAYGGRVGVTSTLGEGSTFWFEIPKVPSEPLPSGDARRAERGQKPPGAVA